MNNKKEILNKIKALVLAGTMGATMTGCTATIDESKLFEKLEKLGISVTIDEDNNIKIGLTDSEQEQQTTTELSTTTTTTTTTVPTETTTTTTVPTETTATTTMPTQATTTTTTTVPTETTTETTPIQISQENDYIVGSTYQSKGEYLYSIAKKFRSTNVNALVEEIRSLNNLKDNFIKEGTVLLVPYKTVYYNAKQGDSIFTVSLDTGISCETLCKLNNVDVTEYDNAFDKDTKILVTSVEQNQNSYATNNGTANIYQGNIIFAEQFVSGSGYTGSSNQALILNHFSEDENYVSYLIFNGNGEYTSQLAAINALTISTIEGVPVIYASDTTENYTNNGLYEYNGEKVFTPVISDLTIVGCTNLKTK